MKKVLKDLIIENGWEITGEFKFDEVTEEIVLGFYYNTEFDGEPTDITKQPIRIVKVCISDFTRETLHNFFNGDFLDYECLEELSREEWENLNLVDLEHDLLITISNKIDKAERRIKEYGR